MVQVGSEPRAARGSDKQRISPYGFTCFSSFSKGISTALVNLLKFWQFHWPIESGHRRCCNQTTMSKILRFQVHGGTVAWCSCRKKNNQSSTEHEVCVVYTTDRSSALQNRCLTNALVLAIKLSEVAIQQLSSWNVGLANKNKRKKFGDLAKHIGVNVYWCHLTDEPGLWPEMAISCWYSNDTPNSTANCNRYAVFIVVWWYNI